MDHASLTGRKKGPLATQYWVSYGCNAGIFLISGLTLKTEALLNALTNIKLNLLVLLNIFGTTTWLFVGISYALRETGMNIDIVNGILILGTLPTTVNMCVVMTTSSKGTYRCLHTHVYVHICTYFYICIHMYVAMHTHIH